jgi:flagellar protein FliL
MAEDIKAGPGDQKSSSKNPLLTLLMVVNILAMGVVAYLQYRFMDMEAKRPDLTQLLREKDASSSGTTDADGEQKRTEIVKKENLLPLDSFTVNLAQGEGPQESLKSEIQSLVF